MMFRSSIICCLFLLIAPLANADDAYVFAFPPRENGADANQVYGPIAAFLTKVTGKQFVLYPSRNWVSYQTDMQLNKYDLVFDGPQFIGWRIAKLHHTPLARLDGSLVFAVAVRNSVHARVRTVQDLAGHRICGMSPPNLATLSMLQQFDNPSRVPYVVRYRSFKEVYDNAVSGHCDGVAIQAPLLKKFDTKHDFDVLFTSKPLPNQGFTAGPRIPAEMQLKIKQALLSPEGQEATAKLRATFGNSPLIATNPAEYDGLGALLKDTVGFAL